MRDAGHARGRGPTGGESGNAPFARGLPPAVRTEGLTREFSGLRAVSGLDLEIPRGSIFAFLGPNGAGKTTTMRLLLGLLKPTAGRAEVLGFDVRSQAAEVRRRCGVLLEHSGLTERLTAEENLEIHGRIWRLPAELRRSRIERLLGELGLWERRQDRVSDWSRGMRLRLAIARALLHRPSLLFLDEPTAGLDPVAAAALRNDLVELVRREGMTVFLNTHNLLEAERMCDRVGVIRAGRLLFEGSPAALRERSRARRVRLTGSGFTDNVIEHLASRREVVTVRRQEDHLVLELREGAEASSLVSFLVRLGVQVEEVRRLGNSLEELFLSVVNETAVAWPRGYRRGAA